MTHAACTALGERVVDGVAVGLRGDGTLSQRITWIDGAHPLPDQRSERAALRALELASLRQGAGTLLVLLSGGGSSMLAAPAPGLSIEDKRRATDAMLRAGADIVRLNCVRKHLSCIKGGRLGVAAGTSLTLALSDVHSPEDDPATIASGPTVADTSSYAEAIAILDQLHCDVPRAVRARLEAGRAGHVDETPKPGDARLAGSRWMLIGNRRTALAGAEREASRRGYSVRVLDAPTSGEAREAGRLFAGTALGSIDRGEATCVIASGETTVTVRGDGRGGRNQEFALGAAASLALGGRPVLAASAGTDGVDGPTDAAGGFVSSTTEARARALGIDLGAHLARNDAYAALARLGDLILWGPTLTNVGDVHVLLTMKA